MNAQSQEDFVNFSAPVKSVSIENLLRQRQAVFERLEQARCLISEAIDIAEQAHLKVPRVEIYDYRGNRQDVQDGDTRDAIQREVDASAWRYLLDESGLKSLMDATAREQWNKTLDNGKDVPELTRDNIIATFKHLHSVREDMFDRGVIACFKRLSWDYKTNLPFSFGKKIILDRLFCICGTDRSGEKWLYPNHRECDELDDLMRIFNVVDGKPEPDHRGGIYRLIGDGHDKRAWQAENEYIHVRWYKKGSGHVTFKRRDLVARLNDILSRHFPNALAAPRE